MTNVKTRIGRLEDRLGAVIPPDQYDPELLRFIRELFDKDCTPEECPKGISARAFVREVLDHARKCGSIIGRGGAVSNKDGSVTKLNFKGA